MRRNQAQSGAIWSSYVRMRSTVGHNGSASTARHLRKRTR
jgi:hypothetical protein